MLHVNFMLKKHLHEFYMKFPSNQFHGIFTYTNFIEIVFKARYYKSISYTIHMEISTHAWILVIKILALSGQTSWSRFGCLWWTKIFRPSTGCVVPWCPGNWPMSTARRSAARWTSLTVRWCHSLGGSCGIYDLCSSMFQASSSCPQRRTNH